MTTINTTVPVLAAAIRLKLEETTKHCEFKRAFIPEGFACVKIDKFAEELAKYLLAEEQEAARGTEDT